MRFILMTMMVSALMTHATAQENNGPSGKWLITSIWQEGKLTEVSGKSWEVDFKKDEGQVGAKICNSMNGKYSVNGKNIKFGSFRSTKMMCPDINFETAIGNAFEEANNFEYNKNQLFLKKGSQVLMVLTMPV